MALYNFKLSPAHSIRRNAFFVPESEGLSSPQRKLPFLYSSFCLKFREKGKEEVAAAEEKDSPSYTHWALNKICLLSSGTC